jgi:ADP-heptose:LPS heptosyltransferase
MKALFKSVNLIGDALYVGPALRAWIKQQSDNVELEIWLSTLNDHVAPLYYGMVRDFLNDTSDIEVEEGHKPRKPKTFCVVYDRPNMKFDFEHVFDVNVAFKLSDQKKQHLATSYADLLGVKIGDKKEDLKPIYIPTPEQSKEWSPDLDGEDDTLSALEGCILVSMFSASCTGRDPKCNYVPNKMLPFEKWRPMIAFLREYFPGTPIRFLGAPTDIVPAPNDGLVFTDEYMLGIPLNRLALIMQKAKLLVTIDNGMAHLGATQEVPTFEMYPVALGAHYILPIGNPNLVWVHMNPVTADPKYLLNGLQYAVSKFDRTIWRKK